MKKFAILFLAMILTLTACGEGGITAAARAEGAEGGDEYEDFNLEEGEIDDDAEPQIWYSEGVLYDDLRNLGDDAMVVANCNEWVSLRAQPSKSSDRVAEVPLGAVVTNCSVAANGFIACDYAGQSGYILAEYLEPLYDDTDYDGIDAYWLGDFVGEWQIMDEDSSTVRIDRIDGGYSLSASFYRIASFTANWVSGNEYDYDYTFRTADAITCHVEPMADSFLLTVSVDEGYDFGGYFSNRVFVCIPPEEDALPDAPPVNEELDMSEIPEGLADGVIYYAHTTVGTIVVHDSAYIYRIVDGEITQVWDYYAEADNIIFDASEYYVDPHNRWYGYVGNSLVHFTEDDMVVDVVNCTEFEYSGMFMYCYHNEAGVLYATSPCNSTPILGEVIEIYTKEGHTFVRRPDGTYLLMVPPYLISQMSQQYCDEHPIPYIYLGDDDWYGYYMQLDTRNSGKSQSETTRDFDVRYGLTDVTWGYPTTNFSPMSVELAAGKSYQQVYDYYDIALERDGGGYFKVGDIDFADSLGILTYEFDDNMPSRVTWESYIASEEVFAEIQQYLADDGYTCLGETNSGAGDKEYSYIIDGGYTMRVVYKDSQQEGTHVFVYVDY